MILSVRIIQQILKLRLVRFVLVGGINTVIYLALGMLFVHLGATVEIAHGVALILSLITSYLSHKIITFEVKGGHRKYGVKFFVGTAFIVSTQFILIYVNKSTFENLFFLFLLSSAYYPIASFLIHNFWTFRN